MASFNNATAATDTFRVPELLQRATGALHEIGCEWGGLQ